jgi:hypothetical protein
MTPEDALELATTHISNEFSVLADTVRECDFGYFFQVTTKRFLETNNFKDLLLGSCGVLVESATGQVHDLCSAFVPDYWIEAYSRGLHKTMDVVVIQVGNKRRAAEALGWLQLSYIVPENAYGETWVIPKEYSPKDLRKAFDNLPVRFSGQYLIFRLHELQKLEKSPDIRIHLEPTKAE